MKINPFRQELAELVAVIDKYTEGAADRRFDPEFLEAVERARQLTHYADLADQAAAGAAWPFPWSPDGAAFEPDL